jgi:hypothetical protein
MAKEIIFSPLFVNKEGLLIVRKVNSQIYGYVWDRKVFYYRYDSIEN